MKYQAAIKKSPIRKKLILENRQELLLINHVANSMYSMTWICINMQRTKKMGGDKSFHSLTYSLFLSKNIDEASTKYQAWLQASSNKICMKLMHTVIFGWWD